MTDPRAPHRDRPAGPLTRADRRRTLGMGAVIAALHAIGFGILLLFVVPADFELGSGEALGLGAGITAYTLGLRHAFDADHIAAIDNTTRKLMADGERPLSVGFWFSLGHASVVFALGVLVAAGVHGLAGAVGDEGSGLQQATGLIGPLVSGGFLVAIGIVNAVVLAGVVRGVRRARRRGEGVDGSTAMPVGPIAKLAERATRSVSEPWHMYPLGLLFGLGFDTATEVALLVLAGGAGASGLPFWAVLCLPVLFAAGMTLFDTADGYMMSFAYGWALDRPARRAYYNITVTGLSVAVALLIGTIELTAVLADELGFEGVPWSWAQAFDLGAAGYLVVALFAVTWIGSMAIWHLGRIEQRWSR